MIKNESVTAIGTYQVTDGSIMSVKNTATVTSKTLTNQQVSDTATCTLERPTATGQAPELPAGILLGFGLTGIGGFVLIKRRSLFADTK